MLNVRLCNKFGCETWFSAYCRHGQVKGYIYKPVGHSQTSIKSYTFHDKIAQPPIETEAQIAFCRPGGSVTFIKVIRLANLEASFPVRITGTGECRGYFKSEREDSAGCSWTSCPPIKTRLYWRVTCSCC